MEPIFWHLRVNHFPIILGVVGAVACVIAAISRKDGAWRYAAITLVLAAASAYPAYWTGERAENIASGFEFGIDTVAMAEHEESAVWALCALLAAGVAAVFALVKPSLTSRIILLVVALAAVGATFNTAKTAGLIIHGEAAREFR
jgi:hypothetical protein